MGGRSKREGWRERGREGGGRRERGHETAPPPSPPPAPASPSFFFSISRLFLPPSPPPSLPFLLSLHPTSTLQNFSVLPASSYPSPLPSFPAFIPLLLPPLAERRSVGSSERGAPQGGRVGCAFG
eukprot:814182-Rhodomonas_salina.1